MLATTKVVRGDTQELGTVAMILGMWLLLLLLLLLLMTVTIVCSHCTCDTSSNHRHDNSSCNYILWYSPYHTSHHYHTHHVPFIHITFFQKILSATRTQNPTQMQQQLVWVCLLALFYLFYWCLQSSSL